MSKIFVNYRRDDAAPDARGVWREMTFKFGAAGAFLDVRDLTGGQIFDAVIKAELANSDVLLAIIGPHWLRILKERLASPRADLLRQEIAQALRDGLIVIPVLIEATRSPDVDDMPDDMKRLIERNAVRVRHDSFPTDIDALIAAVEARRAERATALAVPQSLQRPMSPGVSMAARIWPGVRDSEDIDRIRDFEDSFPGSPEALEARDWRVWLERDRDRAAKTRAAEDARQRAEAAAKAQTEALARRKAEGRILIDAPPTLLHGATDGWFKPGRGKAEWFRDHAHGPEMVVIDRGTFDMGSSAQTIAALKKAHPEAAQYFDWEAPQRMGVNVHGPFAVGRHAVTFAQWEAAIAGGAKLPDGKPLPTPADQGWGTGQQPVINVSWDDCQAYCAWLSTATGKTYRLLSEAEWEYVCRAGMTTHFWWGDEISTAQANYDGNHIFGKGVKGEYRQRTVPVQSFAANPWGLWQVHGNVWEWCQDNWHDTFQGAPADGRVWDGGDASYRVLRGGSWLDFPWDLRAAVRRGYASDFRFRDFGFRVARTF